MCGCAMSQKGVYPLSIYGLVVTSNLTRSN